MYKIIILSFIVLTSCSLSRTIHIESDPSSANVYLDGEYIGKTPLEINFDFYGTREVTIIKKGYHIVNTLEEIKAPLYQTFPIDFFVEFMYPFPIEDRHPLFYTLKPYTPVADEKKTTLLKKAEELKNFEQNN